MSEWTTEFPVEPGLYWFYGYRCGKISCGFEQKPELMTVRASKIANGVMLTADGQFMFESEVESAHFKLVEIPSLPAL